jgi:prephenate dehydrogenase
MVIGIVGVGLIGGSIGLRARRNGWSVVGADSDAAALHEALARGAIDESAEAVELPPRVEVLVVAAHLAPTLRELARLRRASGPMPGLIVDVSSVKVPVVEVAGGLQNFVATHPMAGAERSGVRASCADLFDGCAWAYVPSNDSALDARACQFIEALGGTPIAMSADDHDRIVSITSHVPQVVATHYARLLHRTDAQAERLCGPVARELLRIATMGDTMWRDILAANAANVSRDLRTLAAELEKAADGLAAPAG